MDSNKNILVSTSWYATWCLLNEIRKHIENVVGENESVHVRKVSDVRTEGEIQKVRDEVCKPKPFVGA